VVKGREILELPARRNVPQRDRRGRVEPAASSDEIGADRAELPAARGILQASGERRRTMQVSEAMTRDVKIAKPDQPIREAARIMAEIDAGVLPVGDGDRLVGMITDRDIAVRAVAAGKSPDTPVRDVMSAEVKYCFEDDDLNHVAQNMADIKVRRLPVLNHDKRLVGILSLGDMAFTDGPVNAGTALCGISEPGGAHSQSWDGRTMRAA
jgi:CBS domain-containing protein